MNKEEEKCKKGKKEKEKEEKILWETLHYFSSYDFLNKNDFLFIMNHIDILIYYFYMIHNEYILFLPKVQFYIAKEVLSSSYASSCLLSCFVKKPSTLQLKDALEPFHITLIPSEKMHEFNYFLQFINQFHKKHPYNDFIENYISKIGEILHKTDPKVKYYLLSHYKPKEYYFYENTYHSNILYKKIQLSRIVQLISLEHYAYKKSEYMLRAFSQIAEELGAVKIHILHNYVKDDEKISKLGIVNKSLIQKRSNKDENQLEFDFTYSDHNYMNLNEFLLKNKILNENKFLLSKEEFESNIELKYLISARCKNFIEKYYTQFKSSTINNKELNILFTLKEFQMNLDHLNIISEHIETTLQIDFMNVSDHTSLIDGGNIFPLKEGYIYLKQMILHEQNFIKYVNFLKAHLHAIQNKYVYLNYDYEYIDSVMKIYHQSIELNFKENEFVEYIANYWNNNSEWYHFTLLRDMLLLGNDNINDKIHFVTFQYMTIFKNKYTMLRKVEKFLTTFIDQLMDVHISYALMMYNEEDNDRDREREKEKDKKTEDQANSDDGQSDDEKREEQLRCQKRAAQVALKNHDDTSIMQHIDETVLNFIKNRSESKNVDFSKKFQNYMQGYQLFEDDEDQMSESESKSKRESKRESENKKNHYEKEKEKESLYLEYTHYVKSKSKNTSMHPYDSFHTSTDQSNHLSTQLFKEKLKKSLFQKRVIDLILKGIKGSFYYENGISNNINHMEELTKIIVNVIAYYFQDEVDLLQELCFHNLFEVEKLTLIDIRLFIHNLSQMSAKYYINNYQYHEDHHEVKKQKYLLKNLHDSIQPYNDDTSSPLLLEKKKSRITILQEAQNIFTKFILDEVGETKRDLLITYIDKHFSLPYLLKNYRKYRLFYIYDDYQKVLKEIVNKGIE